MWKIICFNQLWLYHILWSLSFSKNAFVSDYGALTVHSSTLWLLCVFVIVFKTVALFPPVLVLPFSLCTLREASGPLPCADQETDWPLLACNLHIRRNSDTTTAAKFNSIYHKLNALIKTLLYSVTDSVSVFFLRLAKLLFQWDPNLCIQRRKVSSGRTTLSAPQLRICSKTDKENDNTLKVLTCSHSQEDISAKRGIHVRVFHFHIYVHCTCVQAEV